MNTVTENKAGQYVVFAINNQLCALPIEEVIEIIRVQTITLVPGITDYISGMINLRGKIIPVVHLRKRYHMPDDPFTKKTRIVIIEDDGEHIGLIVDEVVMVTYVAEGEFEPTLDMFNSLEKDCFRGFAKVGDTLIGILNKTKVLYPEYEKGVENNE
ncbi:chemotaxis protein CheW [Calidifontibacillus oryziterrae]|uniref:chemotaxis protein CheW n=1 Tax=Calidifontibacillus oryziterrae TaxID=1191699 RepID=UPI0003005E45|nr:chemotaxis protein CheW [Calidifontibacillus oryziterrae]